MFGGSQFWYLSSFRLVNPLIMSGVISHLTCPPPCSISCRLHTLLHQTSYIIWVNSSCVTLQQIPFIPVFSNYFSILFIKSSKFFSFWSFQIASALKAGIHIHRGFYKSFPKYLLICWNQTFSYLKKSSLLLGQFFVLLSYKHLLFHVFQMADLLLNLTASVSPIEFKTSFLIDFIFQG